MYDAIAKSYDELHKGEQLKKLNIIKQHLKFSPDSKLLDIGAGTGISTTFFDCECIGIEPSESMIKRSSGNVIKGKAESLPFEDSSFDLIISTTAIHNFDDVEKAIKEMKRVGKSKCQFAITLLKKSKNYDKIRGLLIQNFKTKKEIDEEKDTIFIMEKK